MALALLLVLYVAGLVVLMIATERRIWKFLVLSWLFIGVFVLAPLIDRLLRALLSLFR